MSFARKPSWPGYFADPFLTTAEQGYLAVGTAGSGSGPRQVAALWSEDLVTWTPIENVLQGVPASAGTHVWAPEVIALDGAWWMYFSVGFGIKGHHLRVARAERSTGPYLDTGRTLSPDESFAIDAHPFVDRDGRRWLFFAHDVLDAERPGTHLALTPLLSPTELGPTVPILQPDADWQLYQADREMYGRVLDWWTLEGPTVVRRGDHLVLLFSGGRWEGPGYGVSWAWAEHAEGPWHHDPGPVADVLSTAIAGVPGPGHNSVLTDRDGTTTIAFHAWDEHAERRQMFIEPLLWDGLRPHLRRAPG